ncbi:MAG: hypothetical protein ACOC98_09325 [Thermodesulfobacteriota bacterium]
MRRRVNAFDTRFLFLPKIPVPLRTNFLFSALSAMDSWFSGLSKSLTAISGEGRSAVGMFSSRHLLEIS